LLAYALLTWVVHRYGGKLRQGDTAFFYLVAYSMGRFWVEMFRPDAWTMGTLATAQWVALGIIAISIAGLAWRHRGWSPLNHPGETLAYRT
jgi:phosphatidylglycerol:prolipoprotein diacylglycerol transferase